VFATIRDTIGEKPVEVRKDISDPVGEVNFVVKHVKED
jgi:hypothetical protein